MKKQMIFALAALAFVGSSALAQDISNTDILLTNGTIAASQMNEINSLINQLSQLQNEAANMQDNHGLLSAIGQQIGNAQMQIAEMDKSGVYDGLDNVKTDLQKALNADQQLKAQIENSNN